MSAETTSALLNHTPSRTPNGDVSSITHLRRTESLDTIPDIGATTFAQDKRELSAWYRVQDTPDGRETPQSVPSPNPSSPDERDVSPTPSNSRTLVTHRRASLSPTSSLTSLESDVETESSLTSLDSDVDDDDSISPTLFGRCTSDGISRTTPPPLSKVSRKRKRPALQSVRRSMRLWAKRKNITPC